MNVNEALVADVFRRIVACGPRAVGSDGEVRAAGILADLLRGACLEVSRQEFNVSRVPLILASKVVPLLASAVLLIAGMLYFIVPVVSALILAALLAMIVWARRWHESGAKLFDLGQPVGSANIIARSTPEREKVTNLIFLAHYDSKSQTLPLVLRLGTLILAAVLCVVLFALSVLASVGFVVVAPATIWTLASLAVCGLVLQAANVSGNRSVGAMDDASGIAILVALADALSRSLARKVNLTFVATGAEELGLGGALRFAQQYGGRLDPSRTLCLNFDTLGAGGTVYLVGSDDPFADRLAELRRRLSERGFRTRRMRSILGVGLDHMRLRGAGLWAISLTQGPLRTASYIHSVKDRPERVNTADLVQIAQAVADWAEAIAEENANIGGPNNA